MQWSHTRFVPHRCLIDGRLEVAIHGDSLQILHRDVDIVKFAAVLATRSPAGIRTIVREIQSGIMAQLSNQLSANAAHHVHGQVVAEVAIQHGITQRYDAVYH